MSTQQCPSCRASVRSDAPWCPQCHLDLRPKPEPVPVVVAQPAPQADQEALAGDRVVRAGGRHARPMGWPCVSCGAENDLESTRCDTCGSAFLASLASETWAPPRLPVIGDLSRLGRPAIYGIVAGVGLIGALLLTGVLVLVGALL